MSAIEVHEDAVAAERAPDTVTGEATVVAGRVMLIRRHGGLVFLTLTDQPARSSCWPRATRSTTRRSPASRRSIAATG